eukprot:6490927-Amphidinium_carterae.2
MKGCGVRLLYKMWEYESVVELEFVVNGSACVGESVVVFGESLACFCHPDFAFRYGAQSCCDDFAQWSCLWWLRWLRWTASIV